MNLYLQRLLALVGLIVLSPVLALTAASILVFTGGPVIYRAERIGSGRRSFVQLKFRTMINGADQLLDGELGVPTTTRVTRVGALLRKSSLDELPQLWNVVRGDMALVGPRPLLPAVADRIPADHRRYSVLPGITGLAQISGRNELLWSKRLHLDAEYAASRSFLLDIEILSKTLAKTASGSGVSQDRNSDEVMDI